jgi:hypothetical protein
MLSRRTFIKVGLLSSTALIGACSNTNHNASNKLSDVVQGRTYQFLNQQDQILLTVIATVMLKDVASLDQDKIMQLLTTIDKTLEFMPAHLRDEISTLFSLLNNLFSRVALTGVWDSWEQASNEDISQFLDSWKSSRIDQLRAGYKGIHDLVYGAHYAHHFYPATA